MDLYNQKKKDEKMYCAREADEARKKKKKTKLARDITLIGLLP